MELKVFDPSDFKMPSESFPSTKISKWYNIAFAWTTHGLKNLVIDLKPKKGVDKDRAVITISWLLTSELVISDKMMYSKFDYCAYLLSEWFDEAATRYAGILDFRKQASNLNLNEVHIMYLCKNSKRPANVRLALVLTLLLGLDGMGSRTTKQVGEILGLSSSYISEMSHKAIRILQKLPAVIYVKKWEKVIENYGEKVIENYGEKCIEVSESGFTQEEAEKFLIKHYMKQPKKDLAYAALSKDYDECEYIEIAEHVLKGKR